MRMSLGPGRRLPGKVAACALVERGADRVCRGQCAPIRKHCVGQILQASKQCRVGGHPQL